MKKFVFLLLVYFFFALIEYFILHNIILYIRKRTFWRGFKFLWFNMYDILRILNLKKVESKRGMLIFEPFPCGVKKLMCQDGVNFLSKACLTFRHVAHELPIKIKCIFSMWTHLVFCPLLSLSLSLFLFSFSDITTNTFFTTSNTNSDE